MQKRNWMRTLAACLVCSALLLASACGEKAGRPVVGSRPFGCLQHRCFHRRKRGFAAGRGDVGHGRYRFRRPGFRWPDVVPKPRQLRFKRDKAPDSSGSVTPPPAPADGMALDIIGDSGSPVTSTFFGSVEIEERNTYTVPSNGDLWPGPGRTTTICIRPTATAPASAVSTAISRWAA